MDQRNLEGLEGARKMKGRLYLCTVAGILPAVFCVGARAAVEMPKQWILGQPQEVKHTTAFHSALVGDLVQSAILQTAGWRFGSI